MENPIVAMVFREFKLAGVEATEGHCSPNQMQFFLDWLDKHPEVKTIFEIGFNAGHSAYTFLSARPDIRVVSLDLGAHDYVVKGKNLIDRTYPGRHTLLIGDSTLHLDQKAVAASIVKAFQPDMFFIDGGHDDLIPERDIFNCIAIAKPGSWFIIDDVIDHHVAVIKGVRAAVEAHKLAAFQQYKDGNVRGWLVAKPIF
jgi:predicted O-methyltransferase YrrM